MPWYRSIDVTDTLSNYDVSNPRIYSSAETVAIIGAIPDSRALPYTSILDDLRPFLGHNTNIQVRLYEALGTESSHPATNTTKEPHFLVLNAMTPSDETDGAFNDWYKEEHIPLLQRVPSWLSSRRFTLVTATAKAPRYLALHEWGNIAAFDTEEFKAATNTPWRSDVIAQVIEKERFLLKYEGTLQEKAITS